MKFCIFLVVMFFFISDDCFAQRTAGESPVITGAKNVAKAAVPIVADGYQRMESRSGVVRALSKTVGEAKPMIEKAIPVVQKGLVIGKNILKILKKILR